MRKHVVVCKIENELNKEWLEKLKGNINIVWAEQIEKCLEKSNLTIERKLMIIDNIIAEVKNYSLTNK